MNVEFEDTKMINDSLSIEDGVDRLHRLARRDFLTKLALVGAGTAVSGRLWSQAMQPATHGPLSWIDVHHHIAPPTYTDVLVKKGLMPKPLIGWTVERTLEDMDRGGVRTALNSTVVPGV